MRLVLVADSHCAHHRLRVPDGDVFVHAGDFTINGSGVEVSRFFDWLDELPHAHKIVVAGNHDVIFQLQPDDAMALLPEGVHYLQDSEVTIDGLRFWGSPWQPWFDDWAFNLSRGDELREKWDLIPAGIDVLITHGPPLGIGDQTGDGRRLGCADLLAAVARVKPKLHIFGHIHEGRGVYGSSVNASLLDSKYRLCAPIVVDFDTETSEISVPEWPEMEVACLPDR